MNQRYQEDFIHAGRIAKQALTYGKSLIKPGAYYRDVITKITKKIHELGAIPAFPPQMALNDVAAHFLPQPDEDIIFSNQLVKLDIGVCFNGAIGDCAVTIDLMGKYQALVDAAEAALLAAEKSITVGQSLGNIGKIIEDTILSHGFKPIRNLSGHGLGKFQIHTSPIIPNYDNRSKEVIKPGMTFAIEPFATDGKGLIYEAGTPAIFSLISSKPVKSNTARAILTKIQTFKGLPFAIHDLLEKDMSTIEVSSALFELLSLGIVIGHAPLLEEARGLVAQAENSILVDNEGKVVVTTR